MTDIICLGELLIDMLPAETGRRLTEVSAFSPKPGGAPANVAVAAARLGSVSAFIGKVGEDFFGHALADVLKANGVNTRGVRFDTDARTTLALIAKPDANTSEYIFYRNPGADQMLRADELDAELLSHTRVLHVGSISLTDEPSRSATHEALRLARQGGALISFDVNYRSALWRSRDEALTQINAVLPSADIVKVNETELILVSGTSEIEQGAAALAKQGVKLAVVTLGAHGSYFRTARTSGLVRGFRVDAIDATGSGDAFTGALLVQLLKFGADYPDAPLENALRYANAAGAITATRRGAIPALPTADEVELFLKNAS